MELIGSMLSFLTIVFVILLYFYHRKIIYVVLKALEKNYTRLQNRFCPYLHTIHLHFATLHSGSEEEGSAKAILNLFILIGVIFTILGISIYILKRYRLKSSLMRFCFQLYPVSKWL